MTTRILMFRSAEVSLAGGGDSEDAEVSADGDPAKGPGTAASKLEAKPAKGGRAKKKKRKKQIIIYLL